LTGANLYGADLTGANLANAWLPWADLIGADLTNANLYGAASCSVSVLLAPPLSAYSWLPRRILAGAKYISDLGGEIYPGEVITISERK